MKNLSEDTTQFIGEMKDLYSLVEEEFSNIPGFNLILSALSLDGPTYKDLTKIEYLEQLANFLEVDLSHISKEENKDLEGSLLKFQLKSNLVPEVTGAEIEPIPFLTLRSIQGRDMSLPSSPLSSEYKLGSILHKNLCKEGRTSNLFDTIIDRVVNNVILSHNYSILSLTDKRVTLQVKDLECEGYAVLDISFISEKEKDMISGVKKVVH